MKHLFKQPLFYTTILSLIILGLIISNYVFGWTTPTQNPPAGNITLQSVTPGGSTGYIQFNNSGTFGGDSNLFWDNTNKRLGIGTTAPNWNLDVKGNIAGNIYGYYQRGSDSITVGGSTTTVEYIKIPYSNSAPLRFTVYRYVHENGNWYGQLSANISVTVGDWGSLGGSTFIRIEKAENPGNNLLQGVIACDANISDSGIYLKVLGGRTYNFYGLPAAPSDYGATAPSCGSGSIIVNAGVGSGIWEGPTVGFSGNVGIGTTGPVYKLDVSGDIRTTGTVYANANGAAYFCGGDDTCLYDINVANTIGIYGVQDSTVGSIKLGSGGGTISGYNGNIGIGTTAPGAKLDVAGVAQFQGNPIAGGSTYLQVGGSDSGNSTLMVFPNGTAVNDYAFLQAVTSVNNYDLRLYLQDDQDDSEKFSVWGGSCANGGCYQDTTNAIEQFHVTAAGNGYFRGNVGIGTTAPQAPLNVVGNVLFGGTNAGSVGSVQITTGGASPINNRLTYGTDGTGWKFAISKNQAGTITDQFVIQDNGNVGIGTTTPGYKLDVSGDVRLTGNLIATSNTLDNCAWTAWTCNASQTCPTGQVVAGVQRYTTGTLCGTAPTQWYQMSLYCCNL